MSILPPQQELVMKRPEASSLQSLIDNATAIRGSLLSIGSAEEIMNSIMIHIVLSKVDSESKSNYDERQILEKLPTWDDFCKILNRRCQFLEGQQADQSEQRHSNKNVCNASRLLTIPAAARLSTFPRSWWLTVQAQLYFQAHWFKSRIIKVSFMSSVPYWIHAQKISAKQPQQTFQLSKWNLPSGIELADPHFYESNKIQLLIRLDGFFDAIREGKIKLGEGMPYIINTVYGWIVGGNMETNTNIQRAATFRSDLYVDDVLTSADNIPLLQQKKDETVKILAKAGLQLTKFSSNSKDITPTSENEVFITLDDQDVTKTLGVAGCHRDIFVFRNLHAGPRILLALLRERFWVINARALIRKVVRSCISCFHYKPRLMKQLMANLPSDRLRGERPFLITGVDFCGPFLTTYRLRGKAPYKTYAAIFVCFTSSWFQNCLRTVFCYVSDDSLHGVAYLNAYVATTAPTLLVQL
ncbi:hypothetical protein ACLKA7_000903 [Drosophila subpalustris]